MALSTFVESNMTLLESSSPEDIHTVQDILDAVFAKTAGSSMDRYGVQDAKGEKSRIGTIRTVIFERRGVLTYHLDKIQASNLRSTQQGEGQVQIELMTECPIDTVESIQLQPPTYSSLGIQLSSAPAGTTFLAEKAIVSVPLAGRAPSRENQISGRLCSPHRETSGPAESTHAVRDEGASSLAQQEHRYLRTSGGHGVYTELILCPGEIFAQV